MKKRWWGIVGDWKYHNKIKRRLETGSVLFKVVGKHTRATAREILRKRAKKESRHNGVWIRFRAESVPERDDLRVIYEKLSPGKWKFRKVPKFATESEKRLPRRDQ
jgi:hypothetical protein